MITPAQRSTRLTTRRTVLAGAAAGAATGLAAGAAVPAADGAPRRPRRRRNGGHNVVVVSIDDLGWREMGCYGNEFNETPEIDRLAREGLRFTQAYAAAPVCSPTRAAMMTGRYPARSGVTDYLRPEPAASDAYLDPRLRTVPDVLGPRGHTTGLIGKWHLTETYSGPYRERPGNPWSHGFDDVWVTEELYIADGDYTHPYFFMPTLPARTPGEYLTDRLADEAEDFVAAHADEPFFLHVSNYAVHTAWDAKPDLLAKYRSKPGADLAPNRPLLAAMLESVDDQVGRIRRALEGHGLARRTLLLVTSDNGGTPGRANDPLRGGKGELYEGGIRVPLVAWGPGLVRPGRTTDQLASTVDLLPTAAELADARPPRGPEAWDGVSLVPTLTGRGRQQRRDATYWVSPHITGPTRPHAAVRVGDHKLVMWLRDGRSELYDVVRDPGETTDLAATRPAVSRRLRGLLQRHLAEVDLYPGPPTPREPRRRVIRERFEADLADYDLLTVPHAATRADVTVADGRLRISATSAAHVLAVAGSGPRGSESAIVLDPGPLPDPTDEDRERTLFAGLVSSADDYLLLRYRHDLRRVGWDLCRDGRLVTAGQEPTTTLDGSVDLSDDAARIALVLRGATAAAYVDQRGGGWEFLFRFDTAGALDLRRPEVRRDYRWAVGGRVADSTVEVDGFVAWDRSAA